MGTKDCFKTQKYEAYFETILFCKKYKILELIQNKLSIKMDGKALFNA